MSDEENNNDPYAEYHAVLHGRARHEREDSVTLPILKDRIAHLNRCKEIEPINTLITDATKLALQGFGSKARLKGTYEPMTTGAGGHGMHMASVTKDWPIFQHLLPEIAFAGHSNSGKSTLVNALIGIQPRLGPANVSDRAGWTDSISFYQLGKKPPVVTVVDFPGYGHAIASVAEKSLWTRMIETYLRQRLVLSRCCVLVDSTRGICGGDTKFLKLLNRSKVCWTVVATKCDLLDIHLLQRSLQVIHSDLQPLFERSPMVRLATKEDERQKLVWPVSASTGAGINALWRETIRWVDETALPITGPASVREHQNATALRQKISGRSSFSNSTVKLSRTLLRALK